MTDTATDDIAKAAATLEADAMQRPDTHLCPTHADQGAAVQASLEL